MKSYKSANPVVRSALLGVLPKDSAGQDPVGHLQYSGDAKRYCIFQFANRPKSVLGSGRNLAIDSYGFVDYFSPEDDSGAGGYIEKLADALDAAGIYVTDVSDVGRDDAGTFHTEFSIVVRQET